jgi:hypothetical protein
MDSEDMAALKVCLLSAGALVGLSFKHKLARRLATLACTALTAGLAVPLVSQYVEELKKDDGPQPLFGVKVETGDDSEKEPLFEFKVEVGEDAPAEKEAAPTEEPQAEAEPLWED